ncbi:MAG: DUF2208 family protein [Thermofilaceae archaeon]
MGELMNGRISMLLSIMLLVVFAYLSSHYPQHLGTFLMVYLLVALSITLLMGGRAASTMIRDLEYIKKGRALLSVGREEVIKLKSKDKTLNDEMKKQTSLVIPQFVIFFIMFTVLLVPNIRDSIIFYFSNLLASYTSNSNLINFISFLIFYGIFTFVFQISSIYSRRRMDKLGGRLEVPLFYVITENGLILEERIPLKAPLNILELKVDTRRRFVEFRVKSPLSGMNRYRLYYEEPRALETYLKRLTEQRS